MYVTARYATLKTGHTKSQERMENTTPMLTFHFHAQINQNKRK